MHVAVSILIAVSGLALLIVLHEGGHFLVARWCGMKVERFSIGFGKPIVSFKRGDTIYQVARVPLGGFVQITGLNPYEEFDHNDPYVYPNRPSWMRLAVLVAGPGANYLTACVLALGMFIGYGKLTSTLTVDQVVAGDPAAQAGLRTGDVLLTANGQKVSTAFPINHVITASKGAPVVIDILRDGRPATFKVTPERKAASDPYRIGIFLGQQRESVPVLVAVKEALVLPAVVSVEMLKGLWAMISGQAQGSVSGPIGITKELARRANQGLIAFTNLMMMLSIHLGLFNLLPIPALDGGRAVFVIGNALFGKKALNAKREATVHMVGFMLLLGVLVLVTFKDISQLETVGKIVDGIGRVFR
jgi:regulator of sigma E protease